MYFISDPHFHHLNIIKLSNRPFRFIEEMNETLISNWNNTVSPNSVVYCLGDFAYGTWKDDDPSVKIKQTFERLNGQKHLIIGNHDHKETLSLPWHSIHNYYELKYNKQMIVLCHYPILSWNKCHNGSYHFHGHTHQRSPLQILDKIKIEDHHINMEKNWRNVCVERINYTPKHIEDLLK